jgi:hypothetical protein
MHNEPLNINIHLYGIYRTEIELFVNLQFSVAFWMSKYRKQEFETIYHSTADAWHNTYIGIQEDQN